MPAARARTAQASLPVAPPRRCRSFVLYLGLGIAFNVQRNGAKGLEAVPHLEMWKDLPFLVRDGVFFAVNTLKSTRWRPGYDGL